MRLAPAIFIFFTLCFTVRKSIAQQGPNDTIRLGVVVEHGMSFPMVFLEEYSLAGQMMDQATRMRRNKLRNDIYAVYPYALTAAAVLRELDSTLKNFDAHRDRKHFIKEADRRLDKAFKEPLKNLTVDQGHVLIKLIDRQTGQNCFSIIKELKGGFSALMWQSVGIVFKNNLRRDYDPTGADREIESLVADLEASAYYRYQLIQQEELMKKITKK